MLDVNRTPLVEGAEVVCFSTWQLVLRTPDLPSQFTREDVHLTQNIYKGRGHRIYSAYSTTRARAVKIKLYEGSRAKEVGISPDTLIKQLLIN